MGYNFPDAPTLNQVFGNYTWDGEKWSSGTGYGAIYASDSAPAAPPGSLWYETDTGMLFFRFNDGTSTQWVAIPGGPADAVRYSMPQTLTSAQQSQARSNINVTKKNYIINGGMMVSQENGATAGTTNGYHAVDQFPMICSNAGTQTAQQIVSGTPAGSPNRLRITASVADASVTAGDYLHINHSIEGLRVTDLKSGVPGAAKTITIQFGVKAPAGTYCLAIRNGAPLNRSYVAEYVIAAGEANSDTTKSVTIALDQTGTWAIDTNAAMYVSWSLMAGTPGVAGWQGGNFTATTNQYNFMSTSTPPNNVFELFDVSLTEGTVAPPFQVPDYAAELALCKRYWQFLQSHIVATSSSSATTVFSVEMRATPIITGGGAGFTQGAGTPRSGDLYQTTRTYQDLKLNARL